MLLGKRHLYVHFYQFLWKQSSVNYSLIIAVWSPRKPKCQNVTYGCDHQNWYVFDLCRPLTRRHCRGGGNWFQWRHEHLEDIGYAHNTKKKINNFPPFRRRTCRNIFDGKRGTLTNTHSDVTVTGKEKPDRETLEKKIDEKTLTLPYLWELTKKKPNIFSISHAKLLMVKFNS